MAIRTNTREELAAKLARLRILAERVGFCTATDQDKLADKLEERVDEIIGTILDRWS